MKPQMIFTHPTATLADRLLVALVANNAFHEGGRTAQELVGESYHLAELFFEGGQKRGLILYIQEVPPEKAP